MVTRRTTRNGCIVVELTVSSITAPELVQEVADELCACCGEARDSGQAVTVDLGSVEFAAATLLAMLVRFHQLSQREGFPFRLARVQESVMAVMRVTHLDDVFEMDETDGAH